MESMNTESVEAVKKKGLEIVRSLRKNNGWLALFVPFALGVAFADVAAVPIALICYKGATSFKSNPIVYAVCALVGVMMGGDLTEVIMSLLAIIAAIVDNMFFETSEGTTSSRNCLHGAIIATALMLIGYSLNGLSAEKIAYALFYGLATYFGIYAFRKAGEGMGLGKRKITTEDGALFVGCVIMACLMILPEFTVNIFGFENVAFRIRTIACVVYVYYTVRKCRVSSAVAISAVGGLLLGISKHDLMAATLYAADFAIVALLSGVFSVYGYKVSLITFLFSLNIISLFAQGATVGFTWAELPVIAVLCIVCEWLRGKGVFSKRESLSVDKEAMDGGGNQPNVSAIRVNGIASEKFDKLAECIQNIGDMVAENVDRDDMKSNTYTMSYYLKRITKNICSKCACCGFCWEHSKCETGRAIMDIVSECGGSRRCVAKDAPEKFRNRCENLSLVLEEINIMMECARREKLAELRLQESQNCMKEQLVGLSNMVSQMADELKYNVDKNILSEFAIEEEVGREFGDAEVSIVTDAKGHNEVEVIPLDSTENRFAWDENEIASIVSNMLDKKMVSTGVKLNSNLTVAARFVEKTKFKVVAGVAAANKGEKQVSGDSFISEKIGYSKFLCGISDGMGAGEKASKYSDISIGLLKNLVDADVSLENAVDMVNRMNAFKSGGNEFATLDACFVDLYDGDISFVKAGAAPSFLVTDNGEKVEMVNTEKMPLGLEKSHVFNISNAKLSGGDCVVLMSDGVYEKLYDVVADVRSEGKTETERLCELISTLIKRKGSIDVKATANEILSYAIENAANSNTMHQYLEKVAGAEYDFQTAGSTHNFEMGGTVHVSMQDVTQNITQSEVCNATDDMRGKAVRNIADDMTVMFLKLWQKY